MLNHPWLHDPDVSPLHRRFMSARLKSIEEMLSSEDRPHWVVLMDRWSRWDKSHTRVVLHEYATVDYESDFGRPPKTWMLEEADYHDLTTLLREITPDNFGSVNTDILDGDACALTVVHGEPRWLAFAEVNLAGLVEGERSMVVRLAKSLTGIIENIANSR